MELLALHDGRHEGACGRRRAPGRGADAPGLQDFVPTRVVHDVANNLQALAGYSDRRQAVVVAYRGTVLSSLMDWIADLNVRKEVLPLANCGADCLVHSGFYMAFNVTVRDGIIDGALQAIRLRPHYPVYAIGHSLGAAMSLFAAIDLRVQHNVTNVRVVNFGSPRVGNAPFARFVDRLFPQLHRYVNNRDLVPHLPLMELMHFRHVATELWLRPDQPVRVCDSSGEDPTCANSVPLPECSVADHLTYLGLPLQSGC